MMHILVQMDDLLLHWAVERDHHCQDAIGRSSGSGTGGSVSIVYYHTCRQFR